jgi:putative membrane protein
MGMADLVPGISGGTIAFIMGFYEKLLESLKTINIATLKLFISGRWKEFFEAVAWKFLLTLVLGIATAIFSLSGLIHGMLGHEDYRVYLYACFFGLILASFVFCLAQLRQWTWQIGLCLLLGAGGAYFLTDATMQDQIEGEFSVYLPLENLPLYTGLKNYDINTKLLNHLSQGDVNSLLLKRWIRSEDPVFNRNGEIHAKAFDMLQAGNTSFFNAWLILCGSLAVCALLLPGLSGSYILNLLGVYPLVIAALADLTGGFGKFTLNQEALSILLNLLIGIILGAICFARLVSALLKNFPDLSIAFLSGFMIGAIRSVWPFWTYAYALIPTKIEKGPQLILQELIWPSFLSPSFFGACLCAVGGFGMVYLLEFSFNKKQSEEKVHGQGL